MGQNPGVCSANSQRRHQSKNNHLCAGGHLLSPTERFVLRFFFFFFFFFFAAELSLRVSQGLRQTLAFKVLILCWLNGSLQPHVAVYIEMKNTKTVLLLRLAPCSGSEVHGQAWAAEPQEIPLASPAAASCLLLPPPSPVCSEVTSRDTSVFM